MNDMVKIIIPKTEWENAEAMMALLGSVAPEQQREALSFLQGLTLGRMLAAAPEPDEKKAG